MIKKEIGEEKVTKVVDSKGGFITVFTLFVCRVDHASIVDEDVNSRLLFKDLG